MQNVTNLQVHWYVDWKQLTLFKAFSKAIREEDPDSFLWNKDDRPKMWYLYEWGIDWYSAIGTWPKCPCHAEVSIMFSDVRVGPAPVFVKSCYWLGVWNLGGSNLGSIQQPETPNNHTQI